MHKVLMLLVIMVAGSAQANDSQELKSSKEKINYAIGVETARNFRNQGVDIDPDLVLRGMRDGLSGDKLLLSETELRKVLITVQSDLRRKHQALRNLTTHDKRVKR